MPQLRLVVALRSGIILAVVLEHPLLRKFGVPFLALLGVLVAILMVVVRDNTTPPAVDQVVEELIPGRGDEVLSQTDVGIDLIEGYTAELTLNGIELPESQLRRSEGLNRVTFRPDEGQVINKLRPDQNCATALYWPLAQGRAAAQSFTWCFTAS